MGVKVREKPRGSGGWWIFIDHQGKRKAKKVGDRKTAEAAAKKIEAKLVLGDFGLLEKSGEEGPQVPTLREYVRGFITRGGRTDPGWFERYAKLALKRSTWNVYDTLLDVHILPVLGERRLDEITPRMVNDLVVSKFKADLRSQTVKNVKHCLSSVLQHAHSPDGYIERNSARGVKVPKPEDESASREPDPFSWEDRTTLEKSFEKHFPREYPMILTGFRTGLRI